VHTHTHTHSQHTQQVEMASSQGPKPTGTAPPATPSVCISLLTDVTGHVRLDLQDPRWQQLLRCKRILYLTGEESEFPEFCRRLHANNRHSGNLHLLFELVSAKTHQLLQRRGGNTTMHSSSGSTSVSAASSSSSAGVTLSAEEQACVGWHLITLFVSYFNAFLTKQQMEALLELPDNMPIQTHSHANTAPQAYTGAQYNMTSNCYATTNLILTALRASMASHSAYSSE
jgi:hypothetical protein